MDNLAISQAHVFLIFVANGILIALIFDIFRILRKSFKTPDMVTYIEDIIFWLITCIILAYSIYTYNNGEIRFYMFIGIVIGAILYILTLSKYIVSLSVRAVNFTKKVIYTIIHYVTYPVKILLKILRRVILKPICFVFINFKQWFNKILQKNINKYVKSSK